MQITPPILPSKTQIEDAIVKAYEAIKNADKAKSGDVSKTVADTLTKYSDQIQNTINSLLGKKGAITQQQLDELDEQIREAKRKTLEAQSKNTMVRYGLYLSIFIVGFGALWLITREKKANG